MSVVLSHPTGNANVRAVLRALERTGRLHGFWTTLALPAGVARFRKLAPRLQAELSRRAFPEVPWRHTHTRPARESVRLLARRAGLGTLARHEHGWASIDAVYHDLDEAVARYLARVGSDRARAVYAYEDGALATFRAAHARGDLVCVFDQPSAHWRTVRRLLAEEADLRPAWAATLIGLRDSAAKLARKDEELALAHRLVVASHFTRRSLTEHFGPQVAITVVPYGAPAPMVVEPHARANNEPLHLFFAGNLTQAKGVAYLREALERLTFPWHLTLAGARPAGGPVELDALLADPRCTWLGHVPHPTLMALMTEAHAFVFPSLMDGFGLVLYEAMAAGLPVITTPNTAGPDILEDGTEGFIVPIRNPDAIAERLTLLHDDEDRRRAMGTAALARAAASSWRTYEDRVAAFVDEVLA